MGVWGCGCASGSASQDREENVRARLRGHMQASSAHVHMWTDRGLYVDYTEENVADAG